MEAVPGWVALLSFATSAWIISLLEGHTCDLHVLLLWNPAEETEVSQDNDTGPRRQAHL